MWSWSHTCGCESLRLELNILQVTAQHVTLVYWHYSVNLLLLQQRCFLDEFNLQWFCVYTTSASCFICWKHPVFIWSTTHFVRASRSEPAASWPRSESSSRLVTGKDRDLRNKSVVALLQLKFVECSSRLVDTVEPRLRGHLQLLVMMVQSGGTSESKWPHHSSDAASFPPLSVSDRTADGREAPLAFKFHQTPSHATAQARRKKSVSSDVKSFNFYRAIRGFITAERCQDSLRLSNS